MLQTSTLRNIFTLPFHRSPCTGEVEHPPKPQQPQSTLKWRAAPSAALHNVLFDTSTRAPPRTYFRLEHIMALYNRQQQRASASISNPSTSTSTSDASTSNASTSNASTSDASLYVRAISFCIAHARKGASEDPIQHGMDYLLLSICDATGADRGCLRLARTLVFPLLRYCFCLGDDGCAHTSKVVMPVLVRLYTHRHAENAEDTLFTYDFDGNGKSGERPRLSYVLAAARVLGGAGRQHLAYTHKTCERECRSFAVTVFRTLVRGRDTGHVRVDIGANELIERRRTHKSRKALVAINHKHTAGECEALVEDIGFYESMVNGKQSRPKLSPDERRERRMRAERRKALADLTAAAQRTVS